MSFMCSQDPEWSRQCKMFVLITERCHYLSLIVRLRKGYLWWQTLSSTFGWSCFWGIRGICNTKNLGISRCRLILSCACNNYCTWTPLLCHSLGLPHEASQQWQCPHLVLKSARDCACEINVVFPHSSQSASLCIQTASRDFSTSVFQYVPHITYCCLCSSNIFKGYGHGYVTMPTHVRAVSTLSLHAWRWHAWTNNVFSCPNFLLIGKREVKSFKKAIYCTRVITFSKIRICFGF